MEESYIPIPIKTKPQNSTVEMTPQEKQLLLVDLCARLPYGVICQYIKSDGETMDMVFKGKHFDYSIICKPYLRPMSSMTEEEKRELTNTTQYDTCYKDDGIECVYQHILGWEIQGRITIHNVGYSTIDWLNEHHFDYRGLIPMRLALEAPKNMYNN